MACVVLPSETARLVYGYLVKEKLDNIALQFLEHSPYLTDCYHIVKSGYQFNTKFLYKELHELIQEYSTIQNLVNKKVRLLAKTSPLYKRIKLHCENLSEIIDSFLFWGNECKSEGDSPFNIETNSADQIEKKTDKFHEISVNDDNPASLQVSSFNECDKISSSSGNDKMRGESEADVSGESECRVNSKYAVERSSSEQAVTMCCMQEKDSGNDVDGEIGVDVSQKFTEIQASQHNTISESSKDSNELNISVDQNCTSETNKLEISLVAGDSDDQIKIVRVEKDSQENEEKNQLQNVFTQNLDGIESSMSIDNSSVLYVTPDVGSIINQDRNQIIVIPIDYYKSQNEVGNVQGQTQSFNGNLTNTLVGNNGIIFEDVGVTSIMPSTTTASTLPYSAPIEKKSMVDDNIVTEGTFLKNKELIYELESKIKPQIYQEAPPLQQIVPAPTPVPNALPTFYLTQLIEQPERGHRRILPKREYPLQNTPIVVMQRLPKNNMNTSKTRTKAVKSRKKKGAKKKVISSKVEEKKDEEVLNMPSIRTPVSDKGLDFMLEKDSLLGNKSEKVESGDIIEKISEEKENLEANEKKTETPAVIVSKNPKRLSMSTPRRRSSHIRALEFETPPKTASEKKSKTSPKVKVDEIKVKNKNVRNTLFKSPDSDVIFKSPSCLKQEKSSPKLNNSISSDKNESPEISVDPSTVTREVNAKLSETENIPRIGCALVKTEKCIAPKKSWDADLRDFIPPSCSLTPHKDDVNRKKRTRKSRRTQSNDKKSPRPTKKQEVSVKKSKTPQMVTSPSKISLTAKRNTYSISGNDERSPVRSLLEELDLVTPFKDSETARSVEETPLTKLFRENVNGLDIDLNMINTPIFPPTPSIIITPDVDDSLSMTGTYYYTPLKESGKERPSKQENLKNDLVKMDEYIPAAEPESAEKRGTKETHEKIIDELVSKAKEIVGIRRGENEDHTGKKPLSGKVLSMVKIQMITQCDKKLCENIPINEESVNESIIEQGSTMIEKIAEEAAKFDLKCELEEKRLRALKKIKSVKENFSPQSKKKARRSPVKRKRTCETGKSAKKAKKDSNNDSSISDSKTNESSESAVKEVEIIHSTPYLDKVSQSLFDREDSSEKIDRSMLEEIRGEFPSFQDTGEMPELPVKTRKKLHYIKHFLKLEEIVKFFETCSDDKSPKLKLKRSHRKFFHVFYKWLKHPHAREVNTSERTKTLFKEYRTLFDKIKAAVSLRLSDENLSKEKDDNRLVNFIDPGILSDEVSEMKQKNILKKKEEDIDDGPVSILPLKKRKAPVQSAECNGSEAESLLTERAKSGENPTRTQTFLQDIDVDRFLSQIHGQESR